MVCEWTSIMAVVLQTGAFIVDEMPDSKVFNNSLRVSEDLEPGFTECRRPWMLQHHCEDYTCIPLTCYTFDYCCPDAV